MPAHAQRGLFDPPPPDPLLGVAYGDPDGLRYFQRSAVDATLEHIRRGENALLVMATGTGKTACAQALTRTMAPGRVLFLAHRDELIEQAARRLGTHCDEWVEIEQGPLRVNNARICVASIQTIHRRLHRFPPDAFSLVIVDEAHHAPSPTYRKVLAHFTCPRVGLTATPDRQDELPLGAIFENVSYIFDITDAIRGGWLTPLVAKRVLVQGVDLSEVKTQGGKTKDFQAGALDNEMLKGVEGAVAKFLELASDKHAIMFWPGVASAQLATEVLNKHVPGIAAFISGETPKEERQGIVDRFRKRHISVLCNCMIAVEGFDVPAVDCVAICRPTKSRALYSQMVGRGTRPLLQDVLGLNDKDEGPERVERIAAGKKPNLLILDFVGVVGAHKLMTPADILGAGYSDEVVDRARKIIETHQASPERVEGADPLAALNQAKLELDEMRRLAQSVKLKNLQASVHDIDPFAFSEFDTEDADMTDVKYGARPATTAQVEALRKAGIADSALVNLTRRKADAMFNLLTARRKQQLATFRQLNWLKQYIAVNNSITFAAASAGLDYVTSSRGNVNPSVLESIVYGE